MASNALLVTRCRGGTLSTVVVAEVDARLELVVVVATGRLYACSAKLLTKVGNGNLNLGEVMKCNEELWVCVRAVGGECTIGCNESCDQDVINGSGCRKVGSSIFY